MSSTGTIKTLKEPFENIYKEKGSDFIAGAFPVKSEAEVRTCLEATRKKYYDASHHCFAFRLKDESFRYSDAGEPNGTAGIRILNAIDHFKLKDVLVIVTRYFGGVKLGVGPLGKAYYISSELTLKACSFQEEMPFNRVFIKCDFNLLSMVHRVLSNYSAVIENIGYDNEAGFEALIPLDDIERFQREITGSSRGNIKIYREKEIIYHKL